MPSFLDIEEYDLFKAICYYVQNILVCKHQKLYCQHLFTYVGFKDMSTVKSKYCRCVPDVENICKAGVDDR